MRSSGAHNSDSYPPHYPLECIRFCAPAQPKIAMTTARKRGARSRVGVCRRAPSSLRSQARSGSAPRRFGGDPRLALGALRRLWAPVDGGNNSTISRARRRSGRRALWLCATNLDRLGGL
jgi:hypothetical protein